METSQNSALDRLAKLLLQWDFIEDFHSRRKQRQAVLESISSSSASLPTTFSTSLEYIQAWEPLIVKEIKAGIISEVVGRGSNHQGTGKALLRKPSSGQVNFLSRVDANFNPLRHSSNGESLPSLFDLVLIGDKPIQLHLPKDPKVGDAIETKQLVLAFVISSNSQRGGRACELLVITDSWNRFYRRAIGMASISLSSVNGNKANAESKKDMNGAAKPSKRDKLEALDIHYLKLDNLRSSWREFLALQELPSFHLCRHILATVYNPSFLSPLLSNVTTSSSSSSSRSARIEALYSNKNVKVKFDAAAEQALGAKWKASKTFMQQLKSIYNDSQLCAMADSISRRGFSLIQGPPGSGKTKTIIALLNGIHLREYNTYFEDLIELFLSKKGLQCGQQRNEQGWMELIAHASKSKPRILVVAPSNVAVDHVIERIMNTGFMDGHGAIYCPPLLRIGFGRSSLVAKVSLETCLERELHLETDINQKRTLLARLDSDIRQCISEAISLQSLLYNLRAGFNLFHPLPANWELRISIEDGMPYWLDHTSRTTSRAPPPAELKHISPTDGYQTWQSLPDYQLHAYSFTKILSALDKWNLQRGRLQAVIDANTRNYRNSDSLPAVTRDLLELSIVEGAQLLFTTLNSCGLPVMESTEFSVTVVDEAAQCVEPSVLIALRRGSKQCVLVGDQNQLPATIFSEEIKRCKYDRSLFQRLIEAGHPYTMLDVQYRMRPEISHFPSLTFYNGLLKDGDEVRTDAYLPPYILPNNAIGNDQVSVSASKVFYPLFNVLMFFDLRQSFDANQAMSKVNLSEVDFCIQLIETLILDVEYLKQCLLGFPEQQATIVLGSIGVITPYSEQLNELRKRVRSSELIAKQCSDLVEMNTVDGFQGREKDIVIISTVRANEEGTIGFLSDGRRMNVAITRARQALFVVGQAQTLQSHELWKSFIEYTHELQGLLPVFNDPSEYARHSTMLMNLIDYQRRRGINIPPEYLLKHQFGERQQHQKSSFDERGSDYFENLFGGDNNGTNASLYSSTHVMNTPVQQQRKQPGEEPHVLQRRRWSLPLAATSTDANNGPMFHRITAERIRIKEEQEPARIIAGLLDQSSMEMKQSDDLDSGLELSVSMEKDNFQRITGHKRQVKELEEGEEIES